MLPISAVLIGMATHLRLRLGSLRMQQRAVLARCHNSHLMSRMVPAVMRTHMYLGDRSPLSIH